MTLGTPIWITDKSGGICIWKWVGNLNLSDLSLQMIWWRTSGRSLHNIMPRITNISLPSEEFPYCPGLKMIFPICNLTCFTGDLYLCKHLWTYISISLCCRLIGLKQKQFITSHIPVSGLVVLPRGLVPWGHNLLWPHSKSCSPRAEMSPPLPTWVLPPSWKFSENVLSSKVLRDPGCKRGWLPALGFCSPLLSKLHKQTRPFSETIFTAWWSPWSRIALGRVQWCWIGSALDSLLHSSVWIRIIEMFTSAQFLDVHHFDI